MSPLRLALQDHEPGQEVCCPHFNAIVVTNSRDASPKQAIEEKAFETIKALRIPLRTFSRLSQFGAQSGLFADQLVKFLPEPGKQTGEAR